MGSVAIRFRPGYTEREFEGARGCVSMPGVAWGRLIPNGLLFGLTDDVTDEEVAAVRNRLEALEHAEVNVNIERSTATIRTRQDAIAAFKSHLGRPIEDGCHIHVEHLNGWLWQVRELVDEGMNFDKTRTIIGPDGKVWTFEFYAHDLDSIEEALYYLYDEEISDLVNPEALADRIRDITQSRVRAVQALPDAARRGELQRNSEEV